MSTPDYDVIVFGATSFVGNILCQYLLTSPSAAGQLRWALAGRSTTKLQQLRTRLGAAATDLPILIADADDEASLRALCARTRVVVSTVGPYALYGSTLVKVCAELGTDYCDLSGEPLWIADMIAAHEQRARASGARIVHCCGFDSLPSDLGVQFLQDCAYQHHQQPCQRVRLRIQAMRGTLSGGTYASILHNVQEGVADRAVRRRMADPYVLSPTRGPRQPRVSWAQYDAEQGSWLAPFLMATINTPVVLRSHALSPGRYGENFLYDEAILTGPGLRGRAKALAMSLSMAGFLAATALPPSRYLLAHYILPQPGEGPSREAQERGFFDIRIDGRCAGGQRVGVRVTGDRDPGYGSTAKMLAEAALCLAFERSKESFAGGFWTPATLLGATLRQRLIAHAGLSFTDISDDRSATSSRS